MGMTILMGVLRMPSELWGDGAIDVAQRESRYHEAADMIVTLQAALQEAEAERDYFKGELMDDRAVCICGCDNSDHESLGEDGECCENEDHQCLRVALGIRAMFIEQRDRAEEAERTLDEVQIALNGCGDGDEEKGFYCGESHLCKSCLKDAEKILEGKYE